MFETLKDHREPGLAAQSSPCRELCTVSNHTVLGKEFGTDCAMWRGVNTAACRGCVLKIYVASNWQCCCLPPAHFIPTKCFHRTASPMFTTLTTVHSGLRKDFDHGCRTYDHVGCMSADMIIEKSIKDNERMKSNCPLPHTPEHGNKRMA